MLSAGDDYPLHQTPEPIAYAGSDRNFYDRYFFNGYNADGSVFFAAAMGFYPQLGIVDAAFCLTLDGIQHNLRASRHLGGDRMQLSVGPIKIEIMEPLKNLRITVLGNDSGITASLTFTARHSPIEEPRFTRRNDTRMFMDYTRMTQNGVWSGEIVKDAQKIAVAPDGFMGTRDRSWGIRPIGTPDPQPPASGNLSQFFWLWAPCNFADYACFAHTNDDGSGKPWNRRAVVYELDGKHSEFERPEFELEYVGGSRRLREARIQLAERTCLTLTPSPMNFYMNGLGYTHPVWGHGMDHGPEDFAYDWIDLAGINDGDPSNMHIQAFSNALLEVEGETKKGTGVLEQLLIGPHAPSGFSDLLDPAS